MRRNSELETIIAVKYSAIADALDERGRRLWAASESSAIGYAGDALASKRLSISCQKLGMKAASSSLKDKV